jgi:predicted dehydrogenase
MAPIRLGVVGCGAIAQVHHLPNLADLQEEFEVAIVCDISPTMASQVANHYHIPRHVSDYRELLAADIDAVLLCHSDPKAEIALAAFAAGKHVFIEKPVCFCLEQADAMIEAAQQTGKVAQAGYMKVYDPAFELMQHHVARMDAIRFVQINHLHTDNQHHLAQFRLIKANDYPPAAGQAQAQARQAEFRQAIGTVAPAVERAFGVLSGSMIHDLYGLRTLMGIPQRVAAAEIWNAGEGISFILDYPNQARCAGTWVELPHLWDFRETLEVYDESSRALLSYPTGFSRGLPSTLILQGMDANNRAYRQEPTVDWKNPFTLELQHFHDCIRHGTVCRTPLADARHDVALIIDIVKTYLAANS